MLNLPVRPSLARSIIAPVTYFITLSLCELIHLGLPQ